MGGVCHAGEWPAVATAVATAVMREAPTTLKKTVRDPEPPTLKPLYLQCVTLSPQPLNPCICMCLNAQWENAADAVYSTPHSCLTTPCPTHCSPAHANVSYTDAPAYTGPKHSDNFIVNRTLDGYTLRLISTTDQQL